MADPVTGKKRQFAEALILGRTILDAAADVGVSSRSGWRWMHDPGVKAFLAQAQEARIEELTALVLAHASTGAGAIGDLLERDDVADYVRLGAAKIALDAGMKLYDYHTLAARMAALEAEILQRKELLG